MPVPQPRDAAATGRRLAAWLTTQLPDATDVEVVDLQIPEGIGFSNETILFTATWTDGGGQHAAELVLRIQPQGDHQLFYEGDVRDVLFQARCLKAAGEHGVPVAAVRFEESDPTYLGGPFFVMERVAGRSPTDFPSYNHSGWVAQLPPGLRRRLWDRAFGVFVGIHALDWRDGFAFLDQPARGETGLDQQLQFLEEWYAWAVKGRRMPVVDEAFEYVRSQRPTGIGPSGVLWGDCRIGNMMFTDDLDVAAVCDWEAAGVGPPEIDVGWWLFLDRWNSEGIKVPRLEGLPGRAETIDAYEALSGRPLGDLHYFEVMAGLRFCLVSIRATDQMVEAGLAPAHTKAYWSNPVACLTARLLGLPDPERWDAGLASGGAWGR